MKAIKNLLVIVDPTATQHFALDKAVQLARRFHAGIELFMTDYRAGLEADTPEARAARAKLLEHRRALLEELATPIRKNGTPVTVDVSFDNPLHEGLLRKIAKSHADLVIKETHYHNLVRRTLITNTDWHLIRSCKTPLLLVKPTVWTKSLRVLAAVDPGHAADKPAALDHEICDWAATLAEGHGVADALHVYLPATLLLATATTVGSPIAVATGMEQEMLEDERKAKLKAVRELATPHGISAEHTHVMLGAASEALPPEAEKLHADIAVMGAVSRSRLQRLFIGNTAERVLDRMPCDLLIVKPLDFTSDLPF